MSYRKFKKGSKAIFTIPVPYIVLFLLSLVLFYGLYIFKSTRFLSPIPLFVPSSLETSDTKTLEQLLKKYQVSYAEIIDNKDGSYAVGLLGGERIVFTSKKPLEPQISSLQLLISRLTIEGKRIEKLDFRYDKPVISLK